MNERPALKIFRKYRLEIAFLIPVLLFLFLFTLIPILKTVLMSFQAPGTGQATLANYKDLIGQEGFRRAFFNTVFIAVASLCIELAMGLALALLLSANRRFTRPLRALFLLPLSIPTVVVGVSMSYLFASSGWVNRILTDLSVIREPVPWMGGGLESLFMVVLADCWKVTPLVMLVLLAGLESIDRTLVKAARVDGANGWTVFRRITLPLLLPSITVCVIIRGIDAFRIFALPLILMGQNLKVLGTYAYLEYMEYNNPFLSAAGSTILLGVILLFLGVYMKAVGKRGMEIT